MNRYKTSPPHTAFVIAALAMTAMTIGLAVVVPAKMDSGSHEARTLAESVAAPRVIAAIVVTSARVDLAQRR